MSGSSEGTKVHSALDVDAEAMEFLVNRSLDDWSTADQSTLEQWLNESLAHKTAYWRLESIWQRADRLSALRPRTQQSDAVLSPPRRSRMFSMAAVGFFVIVVTGFAANYLLLTPHAVTYATTIGGHRDVVLADGSRIELNTDTLLRATMDAQHRTVELLKGEVLFQVKHDPAHPFVVFADQHRVTDLGTKFLIRKESDRLKVALIEGRARLESGDAQTPAKRVAILVAGDEAVATARTMSVTRKALQDMQNELGWQHGVLVFHRANLVDVAEEFNRYNRRKIVIADSGAAARVINATLPVNDVAAFARMARNFLGLHVDENGDQVVISR